MPTPLLLVLVLVVLLLRVFSRFLPEEPVGGYTEVQKAWQAWTFVDFGRAEGGRGGRCDGLRAIRAGGVLPTEVAGGYKIVASAYFRGRGACTQHDPKVIVGAKTLDPKGDAYYGL